MVIGDTHLRIVTHLFSQPDVTVESPYARPVVASEDLDDPSLFARRAYEGGSDYRELAGAPNLWMALTARNFSVRCERLDAAGGWDPEIETPSALDTDVALRLRDGGARFRYKSRAVVMRQDAPQERRDARAVARETGRAVIGASEKHLSTGA